MNLCQNLWILINECVGVLGVEISPLVLLFNVRESSGVLSMVLTANE